MLENIFKMNIENTPIPILSTLSQCIDSIKHIEMKFSLQILILKFKVDIYIYVLHSLILKLKLKVKQKSKKDGDFFLCVLWFN
jgi:hypothetical protein